MFSSNHINTINVTVCTDEKKTGFESFTKPAVARNDCGKLAYQLA